MKRKLIAATLTTAAVATLCTVFYGCDNSPGAGSSASRERTPSGTPREAPGEGLQQQESGTPGGTSGTSGTSTGTSGSGG